MVEREPLKTCRGNGGALPCFFAVLPFRPLKWEENRGYVQAKAVF